MGGERFNLLLLLRDGRLEFGDCAGSVTRVPVSNRTGRATRAKRTQSVTPLRAQNLGRGEIRVFNADGSTGRVTAFDGSELPL